jgi:macrolide transport system ATP-binding/permease protein
MNWIHGIFRSRKLFDDLSEEMRLHLEERVEHLIGEGLSPKEAQRQARIAFGNLAAIEERSREIWQWPTVESMLADVRFAFRQLRKSPGFAVTAVATLALAIAANTAVFAVLNALVLRPLNVPAGRNIYVVGHAHSMWGYESYPNYLDLRDRSRSFDALAADDISQAGLDTGKNPSQAWLIEATGNYFDTLGLQPYLGRFFHAADEHGPNSAPYIVLSYACWWNHFQGDRGVVGRTVLLNKHPFVIIGVAPPGFVGTFIAFSPDMFVPIVDRGLADGDDPWNQRGNRWMSEVMGRLKPGVTQAQAVSDLNAIGSWLGKGYPNDEDPLLLTFELQRPGLASAFGGAVKAFLAGLMLMAGLILLAACANLGSLFAARAADRSREVALRLALGARRARILRQLLTEALLLSLAGGAVGLWVSVVLLRAISAWRPFPQFPMNLPLNPDANVYALALLLAVVSGFLFGIVPVRQVLRTDPYQVIKSASAGSTSATRAGRLRLRDVLLVMQIAVCAVLVTSSIVAVRGLIRSMHTRLGIDPHDTLLVETDPHMAGYTSSQVPALQRRMIDTLKALPGVAQVGLVSSPPLKMGWDDIDIFTDEMSDLRPSTAATDAIFFSVSPEYFQAAGTAVLKGRVFTWRDDQSAPHVAVINKEFARRLFGSAAQAIGRHFRTKEGGRIQVVGVVENGKYTANVAEAPQNAIFVPILQSPRTDTWLVVRSGSSALLLGAAVRSKLHDLDPGLPCFIQTWSEEMNGAFFASRMATLSLGMLGLMGAILSITGIFGMAAYSVSKRLKELGIRVALGARRREVLQAALGRAMKLLALGSIAGLLLGILASRMLAFIVYQASPRDPVVLAGVVLAMCMLGLLASWIPAQRALSVDPLILLREE